MRFNNLLILLLLFPLLSPAQSSKPYIGERTFHFMDTVRARKLTTELWYPSNDTRESALKEDYPYIVEPTIRNAIYPLSKHPLILLSHGTGGSRMTLEWLADALVKEGLSQVKAA